MNELYQVAREMNSDHPLLFEFRHLKEEYGSLVAIESLKDIPFDIKRVFYIFGSGPEIVRGNHANRNSRFMLNARDSRSTLVGVCRGRIGRDFSPT